MAYKGQAAKSASGASMSKYDVEVEARLTALESEAHKKPTGATAAKVEERLAALEAKAHTPCTSGSKGAKLDAAALPVAAPRKTTPAGGRIDSLEARLEALIAQLS
jgi:hypothetical protein